MKIEDNRKASELFVPIEDGSVNFGDVVETVSGHIYLVVWCDETGMPRMGNPGHKGLLNLTSHMPCPCTTGTLVRNLNARLVIDKGE